MGQYGQRKEMGKRRKTNGNNDSSDLEKGEDEMSRYNWGAYAGRNITSGMTSYVDADGNLARDVPVEMIMVRGANDLALLSEELPGTMAYTDDGKHVWMKTAAGGWKDWLAGSATD